MVLIIDVKGTPQERASQQGEILREKIHQMMDFFFNSDFLKSQVPKGIPMGIIKWLLGIIAKKNLAEPLKDHLFTQYDRIIHLAKSAQVPKNVAFTAHFYETLNGSKMAYRNLPDISSQSSFACSIFIGTPPATLNQEIFFARNYDFPNFLQSYQMVRREIPDSGYKHVSIGQFPWVSCHQAINEKGLVVGFNFGRCWKPQDYQTKGVPATMLIPEIIENCKDTQEAIDFIREFPVKSNGGHYGLLDAKGNACVVETTRSRSAIVKPKNGVLAHTNTYIAEKLIDANLPMDVRFKLSHMNFSPIESPIRRLKRISELLEIYQGKIDHEIIKKILTDHFSSEPNGGPDDFSVCTHGHDSSTLASMIIYPKKKELWITDNLPCSHPYERVELF